MSRLIHFMVDMKSGWAVCLCEVERPGSFTKDANSVSCKKCQYHLAMLGEEIGQTQKTENCSN